MSAAKKSIDQMQLPPVEKAAENQQALYNHIFFSKLQSHGINVANEKQAEAMLDTAAMLRQLSNHPSVKQAEADNDPLLQANAELRGYLGQRGVLTTKQAEEDQINQLSLQFASDPELYASFLSIAASQS